MSLLLLLEWHDASDTAGAGSATASGGTAVSKVTNPAGAGSAVADGGSAGNGASTSANPGSAVAAGGTAAPIISTPAAGGTATADGGTATTRVSTPATAGAATADGGSAVNRITTPAGPGGAVASGGIAGSAGDAFDVALPGEAIASGGSATHFVVEAAPPPTGPTGGRWTGDDEGYVDETSIYPQNARDYARPGNAIASGGPATHRVENPPVRYTFTRRERQRLSAPSTRSARDYARPGFAMASGGPAAPSVRTSAGRPALAMAGGGATRHFAIDNTISRDELEELEAVMLLLS